MNYTHHDLFSSWVDGFVSKGTTSIDFWNKRNKKCFKQIYETTLGEMKKLEENGEDSIENNFYINLLKFGLLFRPDEFGGIGSLETALRGFAGIGKATLFVWRK